VPHHTGIDEESLTARDFARLSGLIYAQAGICLGPEKKTMVEARLKRRLRSLNMPSYRNYCEFIFSRKGSEEELVSLIDVITTNKTDFFREPAHFDFLKQQALPELSARAASARPLTIWSAGCSSGEEPYTLAMVLSEHAALHPGFRFNILATDISTAVLEKASLGVYTEECASPIPNALRKKYLLRSRGGEPRRVRIVPELRRMVEFRRLNFMDADYGMTEKADAIFCRNVLIYFDRPTQQSILRKLIAHLVPDGYLFVGHSESLHDMSLPVVPEAPALYRKSDA
jgi:chemotaxis protein methyltransferase CheR